MSEKTIKQTGQFVATSSDGREFTIYEYTEFIHAGTRGGTKILEGMKHLKTADGHSVNRNEKGEYDIPALGGLELTSNDPEAP